MAVLDLEVCKVLRQKCSGNRLVGCLTFSRTLLPRDRRYFALVAVRRTRDETIEYGSIRGWLRCSTIIPYHSIEAILFLWGQRRVWLSATNLEVILSSFLMNRLPLRAISRFYLLRQVLKFFECGPQSEKVAPRYWPSRPIT